MFENSPHPWSAREGQRQQMQKQHNRPKSSKKEKEPKKETRSCREWTTTLFRR